MMWVKILRIVGSGLMLLVVVSVTWNNWCNSQANKSVDLANASSQSANSLIQGVLTSYNELLNDESLNQFPGNRDEIKEKANSVKQAFLQSGQQYRLAASQLEEAGKQTLDKSLTHYWNLKAQGYIKMAESKEKFASLVGLLLDESVTDLEGLTEKIPPIIKEANAAADESHKFEEEAGKVEPKKK